MNLLNKRTLSYVLLALFGLSLSACTIYDTGYDDQYDDTAYEDDYYDDGYYSSRSQSRYRRRSGPYYDAHYDAYYDPYYNRYYSRYPGSYYDPFYNRYYTYGAGSYGRYGYFRRGHGYFCPVHSGYFSRSHYTTHNHNSHGESVRDRNAAINPSTGPIMDAGRRGGGTAQTDTRRNPRAQVQTPRSTVDGVMNDRRARRRVTTTTREAVNPTEMNERIAQIRAQQQAQRRNGTLERTPRRAREQSQSTTRQARDRRERRRTRESSEQREPIKPKQRKTRERNRHMH